MTQQQLEVVRQHYLTHTHKQIADMIGASLSAVRNACSRNGWIKRNDQWTDDELARLIAWYTKPGAQGKDTMRLQDLAEDIGRTKSNVCRKARSLGLTQARRKLELPSSRDAMSARSRKQIRENGHPRGALGMAHAPETLAVISKKSKKAWARLKAKPVLMCLRKAQTVRTNIERYGTASPVQAVNQGRNVYSRCRRGVRDDLGFFVRSRWEANYARYLKWLESRGEIAAWEYEPLTFRFDGVSRGPYTYKPDFKVVDTDGTVSFHEVKGWMDSASKGKLKRFAKFYPQYKLVVVDQKHYRSIERTISRVIQNWEHE
jgi:hypothetical protein